MKKAELITNLSVKSGLTKKACGELLDIAIDVLKDDLKHGESTTLLGFGTFKPVVRAARNGVNPSTGESLRIAERKTVKFIPCKELKTI